MKALGRALQVVFLPVAIVLALVILAIGYILWERGKEDERC